MPQNREKTGRFKLGSSGNPGGRPKHTPEQRDALETVKSLAPEAVETMARLANAPVIHSGGHFARLAKGFYH